MMHSRRVPRDNGLAAAVDEYLAKTGETQRELADRLGTHPANVQLLLNGWSSTGRIAKRFWALVAAK